ncbi:hypothetical protein [Nonomuraea sediminis]|uniref:hypothetical protein n=1 Tax=Nonomuraea sediminis TaxID=2835864 RepID=UPI001BDCCBFD|nr:hypothetical protein [Nonomuraea sediminis]
MKTLPLLVGLALVGIAAAPASATRLDDPVDIEIPGVGITLHEQPGDPKRVTAFDTDKPYLRDKGADTFTAKKGFFELIPAPKGGRSAGLPNTYSGNRDSVIVIGPAERQSVRIKTVKEPLVTGGPFWTRDGRKIVVTIQRKSGKKWLSQGFVTVDVAAKKASPVMVPGADKDAYFQWSPDGRGLVSSYKDGVRFYRPNGQVERTFKGIGWLASGEDAFSPSGKQLVTYCPARYDEDLCVWDASSGKLRKRIDVKVSQAWGWWDDSHLLAVVKESGAYQVVALDLQGQVTQVLADITAASWKKRHPYLVYTPN